MESWLTGCPGLTAIRTLKERAADGVRVHTVKLEQPYLSSDNLLFSASDQKELPIQNRLKTGSRLASRGKLPRFALPAGSKCQLKSQGHSS